MRFRLKLTKMLLNFFMIWPNIYWLLVLLVKKKKILKLRLLLKRKDWWGCAVQRALCFRKNWHTSKRSVVNFGKIMRRPWKEYLIYNWEPKMTQVIFSITLEILNSYRLKFSIWKSRFKKKMLNLYLRRWILSRNIDLRWETNIKDYRLHNSRIDNWNLSCKKWQVNWLTFRPFFRNMS